jgi:hypothetical protein
MRRLLIIALLALPTSATARNVEPGSVWVGAELGPAFKLGTPLGGSGGYLMLGARGEYAFSKQLGVVADLQLGNLGFIGTSPLRFRAGARYRLTDLGLPVAPYGEVKLDIGRLSDVIGANLTIWGVHVAAGADYFLTAKLAVGGHAGVDLGSTISDRSAFYGTFEIMATVSYALWDPSAPPPAAEETTAKPEPGGDS